MPSLTHESRLRMTASEKMLLGKRLRGPSLQLSGGGVRPALTMSSGAGPKYSSSGVAWPAPAIS
jgi:hypothetical protein